LKDNANRRRKKQKTEKAGGIVKRSEKREKKSQKTHETRGDGEKNGPEKKKKKNGVETKGGTLPAPGPSLGIQRAKENIDCRTHITIEAIRQCAVGGGRQNRKKKKGGNRKKASVKQKDAKKNRVREPPTENKASLGRGVAGNVNAQGGKRGGGAGSKGDEPSQRRWSARPAPSQKTRKESKGS